jgi:hypothetical protein
MVTAFTLEFQFYILDMCTTSYSYPFLVGTHWNLLHKQLRAKCKQVFFSSLIILCICELCVSVDIVLKTHNFIKRRERVAIKIVLLSFLQQVSYIYFLGVSILHFRYVYYQLFLSISGRYTLKFTSQTVTCQMQACFFFDTWIIHIVLLSFL